MVVNNDSGEGRNGGIMLIIHTSILLCRIGNHRLTNPILSRRRLEWVRPVKVHFPLGAEAPEFGRAVLDDLREPLEAGTITISRARVHAVLPARLQLVLAANPCPCGNAGAPETALSCTCSPNTRVRYLGRLSGPLTDRIDLRIAVRRVSSVLLGDPAVGGRVTSAELRTRVLQARRRSQARLAGTPWNLNSEVPGEWLRSEELRLPSLATAAIDRALAHGALTVRGYDRILRVAWSIADLAGVAQPGRSEVAQALTMRGSAT